MSADPPCHVTDQSGSINETENSAARYKLIMEQEASSSITINPDSLQQASDKVPLTEFHLCRYEDCHSNEKSSKESESPLDPFKTKAVYVLLGCFSVWAMVYFALGHFNII